MKIRPDVAQLLHADTDGRTDENDEVNSRLTAISPTRPKKKKKRSMLSANRVGTTAERSLCHANLMSVRLIPTYAVPQTSGLLTILSMYGYTEQAV